MAGKARKRAARTQDSRTFVVRRMGHGHGVYVVCNRYDHSIEVCIFSVTSGTRGYSKRRCDDLAEHLEGILDMEMGRDMSTKRKAILRDRSFAPDELEMNHKL